MNVISVIICTHNPRKDYLTRTLAALQAQTLPLAQWELLLIDNASKEPLAGQWDLSWHPHARIIREEELGLTPARLRGIREAQAELLVFVDDDNVLAADYLKQAIEIGSSWPQLGVWGGQIFPEFETPPDDAVKPYLAALALREVKMVRWSNVFSCSEAEPWGAGLCLRQKVAEMYQIHAAKSPIKLSDRVGQALSSGGDTEICRVACNNSFGMGVFPQLKLIHLIPRARVEPDYLLRLHEGIQTSGHLLNYKWNGILPPNPYSFINLLRLARDLISTRGFARRKVLAGFRSRRNARQIIANHSKTS